MPQLSHSKPVSAISFVTVFWYLRATQKRADIPMMSVNGTRLFKYDVGIVMIKRKQVAAVNKIVVKI